MLVVPSYIFLTSHNESSHCIVINPSRRELERKIKVNDDAILYVYERRSFLWYSKYSFGCWYSWHCDNTSKRISLFCLYMEKNFRIRITFYILISIYALHFIYDSLMVPLEFRSMDWKDSIWRNSHREITSEHIYLFHIW